MQKVKKKEERREQNNLKDRKNRIAKENKQ